MSKILFCDFKRVEQNRQSITVCVIESQNLNPNEEFRLRTLHNDVRSTHTVSGISFNNLHCETIPNPRILVNYFTHLEFIDLRACGIKRLERIDLSPFVSLKELYLNDNMIEYLPGDLFTDTKDLEVLVLSNNQLKYIDSGVFDFTKKLRHVDFSNNQNIDMIYERGSVVTMVKLRNEIRAKCQPDWKEIYEKFKEIVKAREEKEKNEIRKVTEKCGILEEKFTKVMEEKVKDRETIEGLKIINQQNELSNQQLQAEIGQNNQGNHQEILKSILNDKSFRDFSIKVKDKTFKVHKVVMAAHSPLIAEILNEYPDIESFQFEDFNSDGFREVVEYIYEGKVEEVVEIDENVEFNRRIETIVKINGKNQGNAEKMDKIDEINERIRKLANFSGDIQGTAKNSSRMEEYEKITKKILEISNYNKKFECLKNLNQKYDSLEKNVNTLETNLESLKENSRISDRNLRTVNVSGIFGNYSLVAEEKLINEAESSNLSSQGSNSASRQSNPEILSENPQNSASNSQSSSSSSYILPQISIVQPSTSKSSNVQFSSLNCQPSTSNFQQSLSSRQPSASQSLQINQKTSNNTIEVLKIAAKLKMQHLLHLTASKLIQQITPKNSFEILILANKYELEELKNEAFEKFKKNFPNKKLKPEISSQIEKLRKLVEIKRLMDEIVDDNEDVEESEGNDEENKRHKN